VRIHTDSAAAASASAVNALAYTVGRDVVFGSGQFRTSTVEGRALIAHELTHVLQQGGQPHSGSTPIAIGPSDDEFERQAHESAVSAGDRGMSKPSAAGTPIPLRRARRALQGQFITPLAAGGGFGGLMDRDARRAGLPSAYTLPTAGRPPTGVRVCARDLQGVLGYIGNHAYIDAPPRRYAIITPLCPASKWDNVVTGTTAQKWDNSPDPCGKTPTCIDCQPAPGVTDVKACMHSAFSAYAALSLYRGLGPNSNTFAGTLARTCCADMVPKPPELGNVPGWGDRPAAARRGATPCPPGPSCR
jgi:Domain of unknown function (DUF4157)